MAEERQFDWSEQGGDAAGSYQSFLVPAMFVPFAEALLDAAGVAEGARVVDVACGTGIVSRAAARRSGPGGAVTGVDMAPPMLAVARSQEAEEGAAPIDYVEGNANELPVGDGEADLVTCHHGLQFFPERDVAVGEMRRVLKKGGRVAIGTWTSLDDQRHFAAMADVLIRHLGEERGGQMRMPFSLSDPAELEGLLTEAGFGSVRVDRVTLPTTFETASGFAVRAIASGPLAPMVTEAPEDVRAAIVEEITAGLSEMATDDDRLESSMTSLVGTGTA